MDQDVCGFVYMCIITFQQASCFLDDLSNTMLYVNLNVCIIIVLIAKQKLYRQLYNMHHALNGTNLKNSKISYENLWKVNNLEQY